MGFNWAFKGLIQPLLGGSGIKNFKKWLKKKAVKNATQY
jgi:hypothetical protein